MAKEANLFEELNRNNKTVALEVSHLGSNLYFDTQIRNGMNVVSTNYKKAHLSAKVKGVLTTIHLGYVIEPLDTGNRATIGQTKATHFYTSFTR